ncbi:MAG: histidinol-phosphatase HisJ family protein [Clostridiales bacterium]|nr:histidinol-phosphatase HisJ family protein [Clostridiales bacterium]
MMDYHMHTTFSQDGKMTMEEACLQAVKTGLSEIAITDHMDIDEPDNPDAFQIKDLNEYMEELKKVKEMFQDKLQVKAGIEIGLQDWTLRQASNIALNYPFDFVIASIHLVDGIDPYFKEYFEDRDKIKSYTDYYQTILQLLKDYDDYNVLGHLDYLRRYSPYEYKPEDRWIGRELLEAIFKILIEKGKGLELNTAGFKHYSSQPHPHPDILKLFREMGGEIVTIGSDAHSVEYVGYECKRALECLDYAGFEYVASFTDMKPGFIRIK